MFKGDTYLICVVISFIVISARSAPTSDEVFFQNSSRSLSLPVTTDRNANKRFKEVPTILTLESPTQPIRGNGTNNYWTRYEVCSEGYKRYEYDWNICVPDCGRKCENGVCVASGDCRCFPRHVKNDDGECVTTCPLGCLNGKCSYDGRCSCNPGYRLDISGKYCRPFCREGCTGAHVNCTYPDQCECLKGYILNNGQCTPFCKQGCGGQGQCIRPDVCMCNIGYVFRNGVCQASCNLICQNGTCLYNNYCQCFDGYRFDDHLTSCIPICRHCKNGVCIEPGLCRCFKGYFLVDDDCEPECPHCIGGECHEPNVCKCPYGRVDKLGYCRNFGEKRCTAQLNGECISWSDNLWNY